MAAAAAAGKPAHAHPHTVEAHAQPAQRRVRVPASDDPHTDPKEAAPIVHTRPRGLGEKVHVPEGHPHHAAARCTAAVRCTAAARCTAADRRTTADRHTTVDRRRAAVRRVAAGHRRHHYHMDPPEGSSRRRQGHRRRSCRCGWRHRPGVEARGARPTSRAPFRQDSSSKRRLATGRVKRATGGRRTSGTSGRGAG